nr:hypothetical protein B0A51_02002 [Rachicladosporium sp. CCFEE 5018]
MSSDRRDSSDRTFTPEQRRSMSLRSLYRPDSQARDILMINHWQQQTDESIADEVSRAIDSTLTDMALNGYVETPEKSKIAWDLQRIPRRHQLEGLHGFPPLKITCSLPAVLGVSPRPLARRSKALPELPVEQARRESDERLSRKVEQAPAVVLPTSAVSSDVPYRTFIIPDQPGVPFRPTSISLMAAISLPTSIDTAHPKSPILPTTVVTMPTTTATDAYGPPHTTMVTTIKVTTTSWTTQTITVLPVSSISTSIGASASTSTSSSTSSSLPHFTYDPTTSNLTTSTPSVSSEYLQLDVTRITRWTNLSAGSTHVAVPASVLSQVTVVSGNQEHNSTVSDISSSKTTSTTTSTTKGAADIAAGSTPHSSDGARVRSRKLVLSLIALGLLAVGFTGL